MVKKKKKRKKKISRGVLLLCLHIAAAMNNSDPISLCYNDLCCVIDWGYSILMHQLRGLCIYLQIKRNIYRICQHMSWGLFFLVYLRKTPHWKGLFLQRDLFKVEAFQFEGQIWMVDKSFSLKNRVAANKSFASLPPPAFCKCWSSWLRVSALRIQRCFSAPWQLVNTTSRPNFTHWLWLVTGRHAQQYWPF